MYYYERFDDLTVSFLQFLLFRFGVQSNRKLVRSLSRWNAKRGGSTNIVYRVLWPRPINHVPYINARRKAGVTQFFTTNRSRFSNLRSDETTGTWIAEKRVVLSCVSRIRPIRSRAVPQNVDPTYSFFSLQRNHNCNLFESTCKWPKTQY